MAKLIYVLNGPNLNLLGTREPTVYGRDTLADVKARTIARAEKLGLSVDFRQSNAEGELIDWVHEARTTAKGIIINAGGYSHTSIALLDALLAAELPAIEVHLSNLFKREAYRHHSFISQGVKGLICGLGARGYELAVEALADHI